MVDLSSVIDLARRVRYLSVLATTQAQSSHLAGALSIADILAYLYLNFRLPIRKDDPTNDLFILSKGHCCVALYAVLATLQKREDNFLAMYGNNGTAYMTHCSTTVEGVLFSSGSLGHGLPVAVGIALANKIDKANGRTFVLLSDGELQEGTTWESINFATRASLNDLVILVDANGYQGLGRVTDVIDERRQHLALSAMSGTYIEIDGHDVAEIHKCLSTETTKGPLVVILRTTKGKGVSFLEGNNHYHYKPLTQKECEKALAEINIK